MRRETAAQVPRTDDPGNSVQCRFRVESGLYDATAAASASHCLILHCLDRTQTELPNHQGSHFCNSFRPLKTDPARMETPVTGQAKATVDAKIDELKTADDLLILLEQDLWAEFITETEMTPEKIAASDERILYRGVELRESAAG